MRFEDFSFGSIRIDGTTYEHDVVIDRGQIRKRKKKPSQKFRDEFGHTPLSIEEEIPWKCRRLVIGTGTGALPVMEGEISWPRPTRPGDLLTVESEVLEIAPSRSKLDRGMVTLRSETRNQRGEIVQILRATLVVPRRT